MGACCNRYNHSSFLLVYKEGNVGLADYDFKAKKIALRHPFSFSKCLGWYAANFRTYPGRFYFPFAFLFKHFLWFSSDPVKPSIISSEVPKSLEAKYFSPIVFTIGDNMTALTNTSITIQCPTNGVPPPTVTWTKDGLEIPSGGRYKVQDDGSLVISKAYEKDNAQYTCTSSNVAGNSSASSSVQIVGKNIWTCKGFLTGCWENC